jgi:hypothetical protein
MIVPFVDDLRDHGLASPELLEALIDKQLADTELAMELGRLPQWYRQRIEALAARGSVKIWTDITREATATAAPLGEPIAGALGWGRCPHDPDPEPEAATEENLAQ